MAPKLRLMAVLAHPDDESLGFGGTLARYAREGVETFVVTATRGERGRNGPSRDTPPEELGPLREAELRAACAALGVAEVRLLGYPDGGLAHVDAAGPTAAIAAEIRRIQPHVIATFGPEGGYGHPDHIAISQFTTAAAVQAAADSHRVSKLYYMAWTREKWDAYQAALKKLVSRVEGVERQATPWPDWAITTVVDTSRYWPEVWRAVSCHQTQMSVYRNLQQLPAEYHRGLWGTQEFYRAFSLVNGGRARETDLFEGVRTG